MQSYKAFFLVIFLIYSFQLKAQDYGDKSYYLVDSLDIDDLGADDKLLLDSVLQIYHQAEPDTVRLNAVFILTQEMMHENWIKYNGFLDFELEKFLARPTLDKREIVFAKRLKASVLGDQGYYAQYYQSNIPRALKYYHQALSLSEEIGDKYTMATMLNNIGSSTEVTGNVLKAIDYYHESLMICEEIGNIKGMPSVLNNIGLIYMRQGNFSDALEYFQRSLRIHQDQGQMEHVIKNLENMGHSYAGMGEQEKAMDYYHRSVEMAIELGEPSVIARVSISIAEGYIQQGALQEAEKFVVQAYNTFQEMGNKKGVEKAYNLFGQIEMERNNLAKAKLHAENGMALARELGFPESIQDAAYLWTRIYREEANYKRGWEMYELYITMRDSILNDKIQKSSIRQQSKYEFEKGQLVKEQEEREQARIAEEERTRRNNVQYAIILVILLFVFLGISFLGFIKVSPRIAQGIIYLAILILFESSLVIADPFVEELSSGEPAIKILANVGIALFLFPLHTLFDKKLKKRMVKKNGRVRNKNKT